MFEQELSWINELPQGDYRAALKSFWRYRWIRVMLALNYGLDFHLVS